MADGFSLENLLSDRNFLSLLAGAGSRFGAGGAGEAIGVPTQQMIQSLASQEAVASQEKKREEFNKQLLAILGGLTPKEMPGPTGLKVGPDKVTLDITRPSGTVAGQPGQVGAAQAGQTALGPEKEFKLSDLGVIPFF
jgi:hypothetical protein